MLRYQGKLWKVHSSLLFLALESHIYTPDSRFTPGKSSHLPCRLQVVADGVEWFIYNRTPAYDDILKHMQPEAAEALSRQPTSSEKDHEGTAPKAASLRLTKTTSEHMFHTQTSITTYNFHCSPNESRGPVLVGPFLQAKNTAVLDGQPSP